MWVESFSLPLAEPIATAHGSISQRQGLLVGTDDAEAPAGVGEATPLPGWTESFSTCKERLTTAAESGGQATLDPTATPAAAHAIECANLDARGRRENKSLASLLRAEAFPDATPELPNRVPLNSVIGDKSVADTVEAATAAVEGGYDCLKLKLGSRPLTADCDRVRAVREAVGDSVAIRIDVNGAWTAETALEAIETLAPLAIEYIEQPLAAESLQAHGKLRNRGVDIAVDESLAAHSVEQVIETGAADVVVCKPMAVGGPARTAQAAATARQAGVEPVVTTTIDGVVARTAAVHVAAAIPAVGACGLATGALLQRDLAADPVEISDGAAVVPSDGGLCGDGFASLRQR